MTLAELGAQLKEERMGLGLMVEDVAARLKVPARILRAIEEGDVNDLPHTVYTRGFIKGYGLIVGYSTEKVTELLDDLEDFDEDFSPHPTTITPLTKPPKNKKKPKVDSVEATAAPRPKTRVQSERRASKSPIGLILFILLILLGVGGGGYYYYKSFILTGQDTFFASFLGDENEVEPSGQTNPPASQTNPPSGQPWSPGSLSQPPVSGLAEVEGQSASAGQTADPNQGGASVPVALVDGQAGAGEDPAPSDPGASAPTDPGTGEPGVDPGIVTAPVSVTDPGVAAIPDPVADPAPVADPGSDPGVTPLLVQPGDNPWQVDGQPVQPSTDEPLVTQPDNPETVAEDPVDSAVAPPASGHEVVIVANGECWMRITPDGGRSSDYTLRSGDSQTVSFENSVALRLGRPGDVVVYYDGRDIGVAQRYDGPVTINIPGDL